MKIGVQRMRLTQREPDPRESTRTVVVGLLPVGTACAFSGSLRGLNLILSKQRYLVPSTSAPKGDNAHRWATHNILSPRVTLEEHHSHYQSISFCLPLINK